MIPFIEHFLSLSVYCFPLSHVIQYWNRIFKILFHTISLTPLKHFVLSIYLYMPISLIQYSIIILQSFLPILMFFFLSNSPSHNLLLSIHSSTYLPVNLKSASLPFQSFYPKRLSSPFFSIFLAFHFHTNAISRPLWSPWTRESSASKPDFSRLCSLPLSMPLNNFLRTCPWLHVIGCVICFVSRSTYSLSICFLLRGKLIYLVMILMLSVFYLVLFISLNSTYVFMYIYT